jgi:hypothetical protein
MLGHSVCSIRESLPRLIGIDCLRATRVFAQFVMGVANFSPSHLRRVYKSSLGCESSIESVRQSVVRQKFTSRCW